MGNKTVKGGNRVFPNIASGRVEQAVPDLQNDWSKVKGKPINKINWKKTTVNKMEFAQLMDDNFTPQEIDGLFQLYDPNHDGSITWDEYICVISLILDGSLEDKIKLIFNCFDEDGNGELSKDEFRHAAEKFSQCSASLETFTETVFAMEAVVSTQSTFFFFFFFFFFSLVT
eukprot:TRINITY_DN3945_c0_g1_i5.p2 TRINITY_DN3945_c0_g1~~TRINITY_DN3945_c0_g1_i5.p2  ORF type:complete len:172 (-),score=43.30 TRINITY_DN3945_c0_g1_i5:634-1149(-)